MTLPPGCSDTHRPPVHTELKHIEFKLVQRRFISGREISEVDLDMLVVFTRQHYQTARLTIQECFQYLRNTSVYTSACDDLESSLHRFVDRLGTLLLYNDNGTHHVWSAPEREMNVYSDAMKSGWIKLMSYSGMMYLSDLLLSGGSSVKVRCPRPCSPVPHPTCINTAEPLFESTSPSYSSSATSSSCILSKGRCSSLVRAHCAFALHYR